MSFRKYANVICYQNVYFLVLSVFILLHLFTDFFVYRYIFLQ